MDKATSTMEVFRHKRVAAAIRFGGLFGLALAVFALVLLVFGQNPLRAYADILGLPSAAPMGSQRCWSK